MNAKKKLGPNSNFFVSILALMIALVLIESIPHLATDTTSSHILRGGTLTQFLYIKKFLYLYVMMFRQLEEYLEQISRSFSGLYRIQSDVLNYSHPSSSQESDPETFNIFI